MAKLRTLFICLLASLGVVVFILSDKYRMGFMYCDRCYRHALTLMREVMVDEMREAQKQGNTELVKGYSKCISKLDVVLENIGEYHEC